MDITNLLMFMFNNLIGDTNSVIFVL